MLDVCSFGYVPLSHKGEHRYENRHNNNSDRWMVKELTLLYLDPVEAISGYTKGKKLADSVRLS